MEAHPAHAEPVNYPFVVGFERFFSSQDDADYLAQGGLILLNELNCVACHEPPEAFQNQLAGTRATDLRGTGSRLSPVDLELMIRNPKFVKRDTTMPSLFAGPDRDLGDITALKHFLVSLKDPLAEKPLAKKGDVDSGRRLYHQIGCVACHAPEKDHRPEGLPDSVELELTGLPSVPMNLADKYSESALGRFLLDPLKHRPSGRMPEFKLSEKEAADLAAYLKAGPGVEMPEELTNALGGDDFELDPKLAKAGYEVFLQKKCHACHDVPVVGDKPGPFHSKALVDLGFEGRPGCLSERPVGGLVPAFHLDEVQKKAIEGALSRLQANQIAVPEKIDWAMAMLNCYACHERGGKGGPETSREAYFAVTDEKAWSMGRYGNIPPPLDRVGRKLTDEWFDAVLAGDSKKLRGTMRARMPVFAEHHTAELKRYFQQADAPTEETPKLSQATGDSARGKVLFHGKALDCASCHGAEGASISLDGISDRLRSDFFEELLLDPWGALPGSPMMPVFKEREGREQEIRDLWEFLKGD